MTPTRSPVLATKKPLIASILIIAFLFSLVNINFTEAQEKYFYKIISFEKGYNSHISIWNLPKNQASTARNIRVNRQYSSASKRLAMLGAGTIGAYPATSIHRYYQADGTAQLLATGSTYIRLRDDSDNTFSTIKSGLTDGARWTWVTYKGKAIGNNGSDRPVKYDGSTSITDDTDGHRTAENLCADLGAPFAELNEGANLTASKWYQYKMMFTDGSTISYISARSNAIKTGAAVKDIYLTDIPLGPVGTTHRYIYRTLGKDSKAAVEAETSFYLIKTLTDDNATVVYADDMDDATAVGETAWSEAGKTNVTPPKCKYSIIHSNKLFLGGSTTTNERSYIYWSDDYNPDYFALASYYQIRPDDGDDVTFLKQAQGRLVVGKTNTIQYFFSTAAKESDWYPSDPISFVGCPAPYSAVNTPLGICYVAWNGIYRFTGQLSELISDAVTPEIEDILETNIGEVVSDFWENELHVSYTSKITGEQINNRVLVYDTVRDAYVLDFKNVNCFATFSSGTDYGTLYSGSSDTDGQIYAFRGSPATFIKRYKSEIDAGTFDSVVSSGTEIAPVLSIGWDLTIDGAIGTIDGHAYGADAIIDRDATNGSWISEAYQINATAFDKLYWNEELGDTGDVTIQLGTGDSPISTDITDFGTHYSDPSGSDISTEAINDYVAFSVNLTTTDTNYSPELYVSEGFFLKMVYSKEGTSNESDFLSIWSGGWSNFGTDEKKLIDKIEIYYQDESSSTATINFKNSEGDIDTDIVIDFSQEPPFKEPETGNTYTGLGDEKIYTFYTASNEAGLGSVGQWWKFEFSETGVDKWHINKIVARFVVVEDYEP